MRKSNERLILTTFVLFVVVDLYLLLVSYSGAIARSAYYLDWPGRVWTGLTVLDFLSLIVVTVIMAWIMKTSRGPGIFLLITLLILAPLLIVNYRIFTSVLSP
jgi:hypothetical protein